MDIHNKEITDNIKSFSKPLQDYIRAVFGMISISREAEKELWDRLTPEERHKATEIARRVAGRTPRVIL